MARRAQFLGHWTANGLDEHQRTCCLPAYPKGMCCSCPRKGCVTWPRHPGILATSACGREVRDAIEGKRRCGVPRLPRMKSEKLVCEQRSLIGAHCCPRCPFSKNSSLSKSRKVPRGPDGVSQVPRHPKAPQGGPNLKCSPKAPTEFPKPLKGSPKLIPLHRQRIPKCFIIGIQRPLESQTGFQR